MSKANFNQGLRWFLVTLLPEPRNTVYLERATQGLADAGKPVNTDLYQYLSPLGWSRRSIDAHANAWAGRHLTKSMQG